MKRLKPSDIISVMTVLLWMIFHLAPECNAAVSNTVQLSVRERAGVDRINEFISSGVPLPRAWNVTNVDTLCLTDAAGGTIPAQFTVLARWGASPENTTAPVKWVLVGFLHSIAANKEVFFTLDRNGAGTITAPQIQTDASVPGKLFVDTGSAVFELNTNPSFNLIHQVRIGGIPLLSPLTGSDAINASLRIVPGGAPNSTGRATAVTVERPGALCTIVKVAGSIPNGSAVPLLDFTARLHFVAGSTAVRIDFTVENNQPVLSEADGHPTNIHDQGTVNSVYMDNIKLAFKLDASAGALRVLSESDVDVSTPATPIRLYQDSSGTAYWNAYVGNVGWQPESAAPRLQSYCTQNGYTLTGHGISETGQQAIGWMTAFRGTNAGITLAVRDFWQNFPKTLEAGTDGLLSFDLFPNGARTFKDVFMSRLVCIDSSARPI